MDYNIRHFESTQTVTLQKNLSWLSAQTPDRNGTDGT